MKTITHLSMTDHLQAYKARVIAEAQEADRIRAAVAAGAPRPIPTERLQVTALR